MTRVVVIVERGAVTAVLSDDREADVEVLDLDTQDEGLADELGALYAAYLSDSLLFDVTP